jgi:hypothetical protein
MEFDVTVPNVMDEAWVVGSVAMAFPLTATFSVFAPVEVTVMFPLAAPLAVAGENRT